MGAESLVHWRKSSYQIQVAAELVLSLPAAAPSVPALLPWQHYLTDHIHLFPPSHFFPLSFSLGYLQSPSRSTDQSKTFGLRNIFSLIPLLKVPTFSSVSFHLPQWVLNWLLTGCCCTILNSDLATKVSSKKYPVPPPHSSDHSRKQVTLAPFLVRFWQPFVLNWDSKGGILLSSEGSSLEFCKLLAILVTLHNLSCLSCGISPRAVSLRVHSLCKTGTALTAVSGKKAGSREARILFQVKAGINGDCWWQTTKAE